MSRWTSAILVIAALFLAAPLDRGQADDKASGDRSSIAPGRPVPVQLQFSDDSTLNVTLGDGTLTYVTEYGSLKIPAAKIQKIELGRRISEEIAKRIADGIAKLASDDFAERERAAEDLLKLGAKAYPELEAAANSDDPEVKRHAAEILDKVKSKLGPDKPELRAHDVLWTKESKITGKLNGELLQVHALFGDVKVKLADVKNICSPAFVEREPVNIDAEQDPGSLLAFVGKFGTKLTFKVTGQANGSVWGSDVYTLDSALATAAVHAGVVKAGQTGIVRVEVVQSPPNFQGSTKNGVTTSPWEAFPEGSFKFLTAVQASKVVPRAGELATRFVDGTSITLTLEDAKITIVTDSGDVAVPITDVQKVILATRLPDDIATKIDAAIKKLGSDNVKEREQASADLFAFGPRAYPALRAAVKNGEPEVKLRAENLIAKLKETTPPEFLEVRDSDIVWIKGKQHKGKLKTTTLRATSPFLGEVEIGIADISSLRSAAALDSEDKESD
jgi:hypothetical protein